MKKGDTRPRCTEAKDVEGKICYKIPNVKIKAEGNKRSEETNC